jgi:hypothetical protein
VQNNFVQWIGKWGLFSRCGSSEESIAYMLSTVIRPIPDASTSIFFIISDLLESFNVVQQCSAEAGSSRASFTVFLLTITNQSND